MTTLNTSNMENIALAASFCLLTPIQIIISQTRGKKYDVIWRDGGLLISTSHTHWCSGSWWEKRSLANLLPETGEETVG